MSDNNQGAGLLGGLVVGAGLAGILLAPFYIAHRFGAHVVAGAAAVMMTTLAVFSDSLVKMALEMQYCGYRCLAAPGAHIILELDRIGWWPLTIGMWVMFGLMVVANALRPPVVENAQ